MEFNSFSTNLHVSIFWSWNNLVLIALSHSGQSMEFFASFNIFISSPVLMASVSSDERKFHYLLHLHPRCLQREGQSIKEPNKVVNQVKALLADRLKEPDQCG
jgi:hypothetical protein